ncbi:hypothetical protein C8F04DRAFT_1137881, partial [Mycena alexandri]
FLFLFNLFFYLRSFFRWLLTWTRIWVEFIAGIYPWPPDTDNPKSAFSEPCFAHHVCTLLEQSCRCAFSFIWTWVEFTKFQLVRGVNLTPRRIIPF